MRVMCLIAVMAAATLFAPRAGHAYSYYQGPWCAVQSLGFGTVKEDCSMRTFEQCRMETIAGNRGFCTPNPRWPGAYGFAEPRRRAHKRRGRPR
jgi:hypothetical protein